MRHARHETPADVLRNLVSDEGKMRVRVQTMLNDRAVKDYEVGGVLSALENLHEELARAIAELERR